MNATASAVALRTPAAPRPAATRPITDGTRGTQQLPDLTRLLVGGLKVVVTHSR